LQTTAQPLSDAPLIRSFFADLEFLDFKVAQDPKEAETLLSEKTVRMFEPGCDIEGSINETKDYGVLIDIDEDENAVGLVSPHQVPESVEIEEFTPETRLSGRVLDVSRREGVIDIGKVSVVTEKNLSKKKKKKDICRRIWLWVTGKSAYEDMIRKIMVRSTETEIDNTIEHIPEPEPPVPEVGVGEGGNDKKEGKNRRGR
jgi:hypothetical protein